MDTWTVIWAFRNLAAELLMPPSIWILLIALSTICFNQYKKFQKWLIILATIMIWITSTNYFAVQLTNMAGQFMHWPKPLDLSTINKQEKKAQAIVILGGGRRKGAKEVPEYQSQDVSATTMERLRLGARLAKATRLPILVTGGAPDRVGSKDIPEAQLMAQVLEHELMVPVKWLETESATTEENAQFSAKILKKEKIQTIYLVTHFWHEPRAKAFFDKEGLELIEASAGFYQKEQFNPLDYYPSNEGFQRTRWVWHELMGKLWQNLKL
jgi:uncharacterized SAM-binding protein YcdF (DUF218 family)